MMYLFRQYRAIADAARADLDNDRQRRSHKCVENIRIIHPFVSKTSILTLPLQQCINAPS